MPDGKPTKAPIIIFGTMVSMSIVTVAIVFYTHSRRTEPYLDTKMRRVKKVRKAPPEEVTPAVAPKTDLPPAGDTTIDAGPGEPSRVP